MRIYHRIVCYLSSFFNQLSLKKLFVLLISLWCLLLTITIHYYYYSFLMEPNEDGSIIIQNQQEKQQQTFTKTVRQINTTSNQHNISSTNINISSSTNKNNDDDDDDDDNENDDGIEDDDSCNVFYSYQDIVRCIPSSLRKNMIGYPPRCESNITTWNDVQECLNGPMQLPLPLLYGGQHQQTKQEQQEQRNGRRSIEGPIHIHLIGERNSGTKFIVQEMQQCFLPKKKKRKQSSFENSTTPTSIIPKIRIERDWNQRNKHFFQQTRYRRSYRQRTHIIIVAVRDPIEWVAAMIEKPYHMIEHMNGFDSNDKPIPLDWETFVHKKWTMANRSQYDYKILSTPNKFFPCRSGMKFHEVVPCRFDPGTIPDHLVRSHNPVYEMKRGYPNIPYNNILELRSDKIINMILEVPILNDLGGFLVVRYEDLVQNGTRYMLEQVATMIGLSELPSTCQPQEPHPEYIGRRYISTGLRQWVEDNLNIETERLLGYR